MHRIFVLIAVVAALTLAACAGAGDNSSDMRIVSAVQSTIVTPANPGTWFLNEYSGGTVNYTATPVAAIPLPGVGEESLKFVAGDYPSGADAISRDFAGVKLSDITALSYSTYETFSGSGQAPYLILNLDLDNDGDLDKSLFFEPVYQNGGYPGDAVPNQGNVVLNTWQTWDALAGGWWDSPDEDGLLGPWDSVPHYGPPVHTLATIAAQYPDAVLFNDPAYGTLSITAGYGVAVKAYADLLTVGVGADSTTYNFEVSTSGDCKKYGWVPLGYVNQGDCVAAHKSKSTKRKGPGPHVAHH